VELARALTMRESKHNTDDALGGLEVVGIVFVILKLIGLGDWPWLWVLAPFWLPVAINGTVMLVFAVVMAGLAVGCAIYRWIRRTFLDESELR
jgi:hypothetical protein